MTVKEIQQQFEACVDQYYAELKYMDPNYRKESELHHIGGILQAALHVLPNKNYFDLKQYIYDTHGYDPGGVRQISLEEWDVIRKNE